MRNYFQKEQVMKAFALAEQFEKEGNLALSLQSRLKGIDGAAVVSDLRKGMQQFYDLYEDAQKRDLSVVVRENMDKMLQESGFSEDAQKEVLLSMLRSFAKEFHYDVSKDMSLDELKDVVYTYISEYSLVQVEPEVFESLVQIDAESVYNILCADEIKKKEDAVAAAFYYLKEVGGLDGISEETSAEEIGAMTGASMVVQQGLKETCEGKRDYSGLKKVLKVATAVLVVTATVVIVAKVILPIGLTIGKEIIAEGLVETASLMAENTIASKLQAGFGRIACLVGGAGAIVATLAAAREFVEVGIDAAKKFAKEEIHEMAERVREAGKQLLEDITDHMNPSAKKFLSRCCEKVKQTAKKAKQKAKKAKQTVKNVINKFK